MLYMINRQSVTNGVTLAVSKSKLVYHSFVFVDNKLTQQSVTVSQFLSALCKLCYLSGEFCIFEDKSVRRMGHTTQSTILTATSTNLYWFQRFFQQQRSFLHMCSKCNETAEIFRTQRHKPSSGKNSFIGSTWRASNPRRRRRGVRGAEGREAKGIDGWKMGRWYPPHRPTRGSGELLGERRKLPQQGPVQRILAKKNDFTAF